VALVVLDASVVIAFLDSNDPHHPAAVAAVAAARDDEIILPASAYAEVLVSPYRRGSSAVRRVDEFIADLGMRIEPLTREIASRAARLRAKAARVGLPDALVLATGDVLGVGLVLTADRAWPAISKRARAI
jgi:PIN domain nuclease of toxin-antitoxin system